MKLKLLDWEELVLKNFKPESVDKDVMHQMRVWASTPPHSGRLINWTPTDGRKMRSFAEIPGGWRELS